MEQRPAALGLVCLVLVLSGCGAASPRPSPIAEGALPIAPGARLYFESADPRGPREMTVAILGTSPSLSFELACGHVEPARALASPTTGVVDSSTLTSGRDVYAIDRCDRPAQHEGDGLPAFLVSTNALRALDRHERTTLRVQDHGSLVALLPIGHETLSVRVDGRPTPIDTLHARASGIDLWVAEVGTPIVVREIDHDRGFTLSGIDTRSAATPHARP
jgi:hypothetical protein